jgi:hypothetical protein
MQLRSPVSFLGMILAGVYWLFDALGEAKKREGGCWGAT